MLEERIEATGVIASNPLAQYVYHPQYVDSIALRDYDADTNGSSVRHYYLQDALFNVTALTDSAGTIVERYSYTPYGEATVLNASFVPLSVNSSAFGNELLYTGRRIDPATGLQLNRFRFYHQQLGRWVSRDPIGYWGGDANLYGYVSGKPTYYEDPFGLAVFLQQHEVALGNYHLSILIIPDDQDWYGQQNQNNPDSVWQPVDSGRPGQAVRIGTTLGAGPVGGNLNGGYNRPGDSNPHKNNQLQELERPRCFANEHDWINALIEAQGNFINNSNDSIDYDLFPSNTPVWWLADDGFNSNSYISGLLGSTGINLTGRSIAGPGWIDMNNVFNGLGAGDFPGVLKPLPPGNFGGRHAPPPYDPLAPQWDR